MKRIRIVTLVALCVSALSLFCGSDFVDYGPGATSESLGSTISIARAQDSTETAAEERATSFRGVEGAPTDNVPGGTLLLVAYAIVWLMFFGFFWRLRRLQQRNADELARLASKVHGASGSD